jgi:hypothetical protein
MHSRGRGVTTNEFDKLVVAFCTAIPSLVFFGLYCDSGSMPGDSMPPGIGGMFGILSASWFAVGSFVFLMLCLK